MKTLKLKTIILSGLFFVAIYSCNSDPDITPNLTDEESIILANADLFGKTHNDCLAFTYKNLITQTRATNEKVSFANAIELINRYVSIHTQEMTRSVNEIGYDIEIYEQTTIEDIKAQMSQREIYYTEFIETSIDRLLAKDDFYDLKLQVINDHQLNQEQKEAICCFISTAVASHEYWSENLEYWDLLIGNSDIETRANEVSVNPGEIISTDGLSWRAERIIFSDAYWGFTGMISSGLNPIVGGGAAAAGSAIAAFR